MYIDTHAHLTMPEYQDLNEVLVRAKEAGVSAIVNASFDLESSRASVRLAEREENIYAAVGVHPHDAHALTDDMLSAIKELCGGRKVVAVGETGLDHYRCPVPKEDQENAFRRLLVLAQELDLPAIVHCREASGDVMRIMREENRGKLRAVFHCFAGGEELVRFALDNGFMISFTGNITFKKAGSLREYVRMIPLSSMMIETDCPYLSPDPFRGERNEPAHVRYVAKAVSELKGVSLEVAAEATSRNAVKFFGLPL